MKRNLVYLIGCAVVMGISAGADDGATAEAAKKDKYFQRADANGDGSVSNEEFVAITKAQFEKKGKEGYEAEAAKRFAKKDADADGSLTKEEFLSMPGKKKAAE